jgi:hypothetical protein
MFGIEAMAVSVALSMVDAQMEAYFYENVRNMPIECQAQAIREHKDQREKQRLEAREDRKHRELCDAIRDSGRRSAGSSYGGSGLAMGILLGEAFRG